MDDGLQQFQLDIDDFLPSSFTYEEQEVPNITCLGRNVQASTTSEGDILGFDVSRGPHECTLLELPEDVQVQASAPQDLTFLDQLRLAIQIVTADVAFGNHATQPVHINEIRQVDEECHINEIRQVDEECFFSPAMQHMLPNSELLPLNLISKIIATNIPRKCKVTRWGKMYAQQSASEFMACVITEAADIAVATGARRMTISTDHVLRALRALGDCSKRVKLLPTASNSTLLSLEY